MIRRSITALFPIVLAALALSSGAQVVPSAFNRGLSITAGGEASMFQPDYTGYGTRATSSTRLYGLGAFVDMRFSRWVQLEAEGRWLRFNQVENIYEDNYLIGPRVPITQVHFLRATPYVKALIGYGRMNFENNDGQGRYTDFAYGAGLDIKLTNRINIRAVDFENQIWPKWVEPPYSSVSLWPYGFSAGVSYQVMGRR